jgi:hypothetical protein
VATKPCDNPALIFINSWPRMAIRQSLESVRRLHVLLCNSVCHSIINTAAKSTTSSYKDLQDGGVGGSFPVSDSFSKVLSISSSTMTASAEMLRLLGIYDSDDTVRQSKHDSWCNFMIPSYSAFFGISQ